jgi:hypothetical protein
MIRLTEAWDEAAGPRELAASLCPNETVLSDAGLTSLVDTAFRVSLKQEEGRYPSFQVFAPLAGANEPLLDMRFSPPLPLTMDVLHRVSPGIPPRPYAFVVKEGPDGLRLEGAARVEYSGFAALRGKLDYHGGTLFPGLALHVAGPARIRTALFSKSGPVKYLELKEGRLKANYDNAFSPIFLPLCRQGATVLAKGTEDSATLPSLVKATLARVFSLAVAAGHGGMFVFLPPGRDRASLGGMLTAGVGVSWPNLGKVAVNLAAGGPHDATHVEQWETATRVAAQASCVDGAVILDAAFSVLGFRMELCGNREELLPACVALDPRASEPTSLGEVLMTSFGTRHRSAARFCAAVPGAVAVVVSQDGEMREMTSLPDGTVGVCGPLTPMTVSSPLL